MKEVNYNDIYVDMEQLSKSLSIELWKVNPDKLKVIEYINKLKDLTNKFNMV